MSDDLEPAVAYKVWQVDCPNCGAVIAYTEDSHPDHCEECGAPVEESDKSG